MPRGVEGDQLQLRGTYGEVSSGTEGTIQGTLFGGVVLRVRIRHSEQHQHLAKLDPSGTGKSNDACECIKVSKDTPWSSLFLSNINMQIL